MRVLMASQFYPPVAGGQEEHVRNLARTLSSRGHPVEVATIATDGVEETVMDGSVPVHRLGTTAQVTARRMPRLYTDPGRPHAMPTADPHLRAGLARLLASRSFDVLHAHDWIVNSALGPANSRGVPLAVTLHDYSHVCATKRLMRGGEVCPGPELAACARCASAQYGPVVGPGVVAANLVARRARRRGVGAFIAVSSAVARDTGLATDHRCEVIPNFVPDELVLDEVSPARDGPVVFVGDLSRDKGVDVLFQAYRGLHHPPPLQLAGRVLPDTPRDRPENAVVLGPVSHDQAIELIRGAMLLVAPSIVPDCCPTVVLEAMAAGKPVVAATSGGIPDLVEDGRTGLLVPPGDPDALAGALARLISGPGLRASMGQRALGRVRSFTASAVVGRIEAVYERLVGSGA
jgi:glycogen(starch) synthase